MQVLAGAAGLALGPHHVAPPMQPNANMMPGHNGRNLTAVQAAHNVATMRSSINSLMPPHPGASTAAEQYRTESDQT
jgi:hypothetical protein